MRVCFPGLGVEFTGSVGASGVDGLIWEIQNMRGALGC